VLRIINSRKNEIQPLLKVVNNFMLLYIGTAVSGSVLLLDYRYKNELSRET
jgi:hypothetical protein